MELEKLENKIKNHLINFHILNKSAEEKKINSILDSIFGAIVRSKTSFIDFNLFLEDITNELVFNHEFLSNGGNIYNYICCKWENICRHLFRLRPVGLGTPNAASGEGELLLNFISKYLSKPKKGDLNYKYIEEGITKDIIYEIKGSGFRVFGNITEKSFNEAALKVAKKHKFEPNISKRSNISAVELEKNCHLNYWNNEFKYHCREDIFKFIEDWLRLINNNFNMDKESQSYNLLNNNNELQIEYLKKIIVKQLFTKFVENSNFNYLIYLGNNGENCKVITNEEEKFNSMIDNNEIKISDDYFRINQDNKIGFYIDFK